MGMYDNLYDSNGRDWQTKAFDCVLADYTIGDTIPTDGGPAVFQVEILGEINDDFVHSYATVRDGVLASVHDSRDERLALLDYSGGCVATPEGI